ncbi:hypothetical protein [Candidatus Magnetominusculus xianensis]|uniref:Membrane protein n=1 Tax=Candidatus Magnetominusculus xianensis TaxID=1748249 RepID=A0ABR5SBE8_9BACT|nr:hypothetical protein [Candidatus Magnetominusculus xianensis]KWT77350.1 membrane protein [Candidatus Magnetominusculus xianensis]MBF0404967.1 hypothetical protein [Nitrospirota bacterium]
MMIKLGDVEFPNQIFWPNRFEWTGVSETAERTLSGGVIVYGSEISGRHIDLEGRDNMCWITYAQVKVLQAMASVQDAEYELVYDDETFNVRFRHEDAPALEFSPVIERSAYNDNDYFNCKIRLMEV